MALAIDGSATGIADASATSVSAAALTTANAGDIICVAVVAERTSGQGSYSTVSSISVTSGTAVSGFVQASINGTPAQIQFVNTAVSSSFVNIELWWAYSASALTSTVLKVSLSVLIDNVAIGVFGISGFTGTNYQTNPFDPNASNPNKTTAVTNSQPVSTAFSTTNAATLIYSINGTSADASITVNTIGGAAATAGVSAAETAGTLFAALSSQYIVESTVKTSITSNTSSGMNGWGLLTVVFAQTGGTSALSLQGSQPKIFMRSMHGLGEKIRGIYRPRRPRLVPVYNKLIKAA